MAISTLHKIWFIINIDCFFILQPGNLKYTFPLKWRIFLMQKYPFISGGPYRRFSKKQKNAGICIKNIKNTILHTKGCGNAPFQLDSWILWDTIQIFFPGRFDSFSCSFYSKFFSPVFGRLQAEIPSFLKIMAFSPPIYFASN